MDSMSHGELSFLLVMALIGFIVKPLAGSGLGTMGLIRSAIGNIDSAREDYDARKGSHVWLLEVKGRDNRSYENISGTYPVIGPYGETGFILESPQGPRSLCHAGSCDWYPEHAALIKGKPEHTTTTTIQLKKTNVDSLVDKLAPLQASGNVYLIGTVSAKRIAPAPPTIEIAGDTITLNYAKLSPLMAWGNKPLNDVNLTIQIRHAPGVEVTEINVITESADVKIHPLLKKWIKTTKGTRK
jgi:inner membrane protein